MSADDLTQKKCSACEGHEEPMTADEAQEQLQQLSGWSLVDDGTKIQKEYTRDDFQGALSFVNYVGDIAEEEGHHPDILIHSYNKVQISLSTHAIGGLSENDFIVAAKIDEAGT